jgi:CarD family transcriptional regulator
VIDLLCRGKAFWAAIIARLKGLQMTFSLEEKVVYPGYGVAKISRIVEKKIAGSSALFYELVFLHRDMTILVPQNNVLSVGIRKLSSTQHIDALFRELAEPVVEQSSDACLCNWNKRNKEYQFKLRSGNIQEICKIYRDLRSIEKRKELSFGERSLLQQTELLLVEEIALVRDMLEEKATEELRAMLPPRHMGRMVQQL